uniref:TIP41-like protein n=3 Tax=Passeriformes TaxID=9126 RepID=U3JT72_FICAL
MCLLSRTEHCRVGSVEPSRRAGSPPPPCWQHCSRCIPGFHRRRGSAPRAPREAETPRDGGSGGAAAAVSAVREETGGDGRRREERGSAASAASCLLLRGEEAAMHPVFQSSRRDFTFGPWKLSAARTHIMKSAQAERLADELHMPSVPEMMFGDNVLRIQHDDGFGIEFNATDALKCVNNCQGMIKVACAEEWQESRSETEHSKEVVKPYDWTYTTDYKGTLLGDTATLKVVPTTEHINTEKLKAREQIMFFEEVLLFEDELHDHGVSSLSVKVRVMPSSFFVLLRFFLRVDGVLIRMNDTRLHHEVDKTYMLREYTSRESKISSLKSVPPSLFTEPNEISQYLPIKETICEKLEFPEKLEPKPETSLESTCAKSK